jgi:general secretion pathway protein D
LFDTIGKLAGVNVLFDPDYDGQQGQIKPTSIDLNNSTLEEAPDYVSIATKSFWKPLSANTIFVSVENPGKHRDYDEQVVKVFYLSNVTSPQELNEIVTTLRTVAEITKLFNYTAQNALIIRAEADRMALAEKIIADLDKPKAEVVIDVMVMEVNSVHMRNLAAAFAPNGITSQLLFTPRSSILSNTANSITTNTTGTGTGVSGGTVTPTGTGTTGTGTGTTTTTSTSGAIPLANLRHISLKDYSLTNVPNGLIEAVLNDTGTRVLQNPQIRAVDNFKAVLKIGDKVPTATGSFGNGAVGGVGGGGLLVNTQFTFIDTGVNLEITPKVHENKEVSLHVDIDISQVKDHIDSP